MDKRHKVLIVDDTEMNRLLLAEMLGGAYDILEAVDGQDAVRIIQEYERGISLILLDIVMPKMDGFEVLAMMNKGRWIENIPVIMISSETSAAYIDQAYDLGATDYISRPFDINTVRRRVENTIMLYAKQNMLRNMVTDQMLEKEKNNYLMVEVLSTIVEFRNGESGLHVVNIRTITDTLLKCLVRMTDQYRLNSKDIALIVNASSLHDIGKISISEEILNKPGKLTPEEFEIMKTHAAIGAEMLMNVTDGRRERLIATAHDICRWHHERYDGGGYPDGLRGEEIPIAAQVVALADVYDALTSTRVYKPAFSHEKALRMIMDGECGTFNPLLLECLKTESAHISRTLRLRSSNGVINSERKSIASSLVERGDLTVSDRTLNLLERECTKYQFCIAVSQEIFFEYHAQTDILNLSEWGARYLDIDELLVSPATNEKVWEIIKVEDWMDIHNKVKEAPETDPIIQGIYCLHVRGQEKQFHLAARALWENEERTVYGGSIGKFVEIHDQKETEVVDRCGQL